jgi:hypothetical protein
MSEFIDGFRSEFPSRYRLGAYVASCVRVVMGLAAIGGGCALAVVILMAVLP